MSKEVVIAVEDLKRNRAYSKDRPNSPKDCREGVSAIAKARCISGHSWKFVRFDNYGCCSNCGCEVLT